LARALNWLPGQTALNWLPGQTAQSLCPCVGAVTKAPLFRPNFSMASHIVWGTAGDPSGESLAETEPSQREGSSSIRETDLPEQQKPKNAHIIWSRTTAALRRIAGVQVLQGSSYSEDLSSGSLRRGSSSEEPSQQSKLSRGSSRRYAGVPPTTTLQGDITVLLDEQGNPTSIGSATHYEGTCKPCVFVTSKRECRNGVNCTFCHFPHKRASAGKRSRFRKYMERAETIIDNDPNQLGDVTAKLPRSIEQDEKRKSDVVSKLIARAGKAKAAMMGPG